MENCRSNSNCFRFFCTRNNVLKKRLLTAFRVMRKEFRAKEGNVFIYNSYIELWSCHNKRLAQLLMEKVI